MSTLIETHRIFIIYNMALSNLLNRKLLFLLFICSYLFNNANSQINEATFLRTENWRGFEKEVYTFNHYEAWIVKPKKALEGNPWIWKAYFPDWHVAIDSILLTRGFNMAYIYIPDMFGSPVLNDIPAFTGDRLMNINITPVYIAVFIKQFWRRPRFSFC